MSLFYGGMICVALAIGVFGNPVAGIWLASVTSIGAAADWVLNGGLDDFIRGRYLAGLKEGTNKDTQDAIDRISKEEIESSHLRGLRGYRSLSERFRDAIRKKEAAPTIVAYAKLHGINSEFMGRSLENGHYTNPLHYAVLTGNLEAVKALLATGADVNWPIAGENRILHDAVYNGTVEVVDALLQAGADANPGVNGRHLIDVVKTQHWHGEKRDQLIKLLTEAGAQAAAAPEKVIDVMRPVKLKKDALAP